MTTQTEALKLALEALDQLTNAADTFSVSGVYFNEEVWAKKCLSDAYFAITTIEEALAQPEQEYKRGYADAMNWKVQNHLEHLQPKVRTGDCLLTGVCASEGHKIQPKEPEQKPVAVYGYCPECGAEGVARERRPDGNDCCANGHTYPSRTANKTPQRTWVGLTIQEANELWESTDSDWELMKRTEAKLKEKNQ